jgi:hypothetical protein
MRFRQTAKWRNGQVITNEYGLDEMREEMHALGDILDALCPGEPITIERIE